MFRAIVGKSRRGVTAFEMMLATTILTLVLVAGVTVMGTTLQSWTRNTRKVDAENDTTYAVRYIASKLQEAYSASVSNGGKTLTYTLPVKDGNGNYQTPVTPESTARSFYISDGKLYENNGVSTKLILDKVASDDPSMPGASKVYTPFTAGAGQIVRTVTVHLVTYRQLSSSDQFPVRVRHRQTIMIRNSPVITH